MYTALNVNPKGNLTTDCAVRSIALATGKSWDDVFIGITAIAFNEKLMPDTNSVWSKYLKNKGFKRHSIPDSCPDCYTVSDFAADHSTGTYVVCCDGHVVCVKDGVIYDTSDCGKLTALYYWKLEE